MEEYDRNINIKSIWNIAWTPISYLIDSNSYTLFMTLEYKLPLLEESLPTYNFKSIQILELHTHFSENNYSKSGHVPDLIMCYQKQSSYSSGITSNVPCYITSMLTSLRKDQRAHQQVHINDHIINYRSMLWWSQKYPQNASEWYTSWDQEFLSNALICHVGTTIHRVFLNLVSPLREVLL